MKTLLTIDIGNSCVKLCVLEGESVVYATAGRNLGPEAVEALLAYNTVDGIVYCCVGRDDMNLKGWLERCAFPVLFLSAETPLPVELRYKTPSSLGSDRIAAAVGAMKYGDSVFVVDAGTAVTADLVVGKVFMGGNISPGINLRFKALHEFTSLLPMVDSAGPLPDFGYDTVTAVRAGVVGGLVAELKAEYECACNIDSDTKMVLTGGDAQVLAPLLRKSAADIVVDPDIVAKGLVEIFNYNF